MIYLDDNFPWNEKMLEAGPLAGWLYVAGLGWLKQHDSTDGRIPKSALSTLAAVPRTTAGRLVKVGAWVDEGTHWLVPKYATKNAAAIAKSEKARASARKRWDAVATDRVHKSTSNPQCESDANADANASDSHMQQITSEPVNQLVDPSTGSSQWHPTENRPEETTPITPTAQGSHRSVAHDLAAEVFADDRKPLSDFGTVRKVLADALAAGRTVDELRVACVGQEVTWSNRGLSTALSRSRSSVAANGFRGIAQDAYDRGEIG